MSVEPWILALAERCLSPRTFQLVVAPALADLQFERDAGVLRRLANHLGVMRAIAGGVGDDLARDSGGFLLLTLLPATYYVFLLVICFDVFSIGLSTDFAVVALVLLVLSFAPVMACFWPERPSRKVAD